MKKLLILMLLATSAMAQIPTDSLVGYYPFTGNANDYSGKSNNGTVHGATLTTDRFGNPNCAYSFNGVNNYIAIDSFTVKEFTLSSWIYPTNINTSNLNAIISKLNSNNYHGYEFRINGQDSTLMLVTGTGNAWVQPITPFKFNTNTWYNVVATSNDTVVKLYVNSVKVLSYNFSHFSDNTDSILFGTRSDNISNGGWFTGKLDDIRMYNRPLDSIEVSALFNEGVCFKTVYDTTHVTIRDTIYTHIAVTDTLKINLTLTGIASPNNTNTIKVYPNPVKDHITVDFGDYTSMNGYTLKISNMLGQVVFTTNVTQQQTYIDLSTFTGKGTYIVNVIDGTGNMIDTKKIILN